MTKTTTMRRRRGTRTTRRSSQILRNVNVRREDETVVKMSSMYVYVVEVKLPVSRVANQWNVFWRTPTAHPDPRTQTRTAKAHAARYSMTVDEPHALGVQPFSVAFTSEHTAGAAGSATSSPARNSEPLIIPIAPPSQAVSV